MGRWTVVQRGLCAVFTPLSFAAHSHGHQEISATIQRPQGNNSSHPLGSNNKGPYTKIFLHF